MFATYEPKATAMTVLDPVPADSFDPPSASLDPPRGHALVHGDRQATYGPPRENLTRIAGMWSAMVGAPITAEQVALMMVALKASRLWHLINDDGLDDIDGYVEVIRVLRSDA